MIDDFQTKQLAKFGYVQRKDDRRLTRYIVKRNPPKLGKKEDQEEPGLLVKGSI